MDIEAIFYWLLYGLWTGVAVAFIALVVWNRGRNVEAWLLLLLALAPLVPVSVIVAVTALGVLLEPAAALSDWGLPYHVAAVPGALLLVVACSMAVRALINRQKLARPGLVAALAVAGFAIVFVDVQLLAERARVMD
jgi:hypothetical protein